MDMKALVGALAIAATIRQVEELSGFRRANLGRPPRPPSPRYCVNCGAPRENPTNFGRDFAPCSYCKTP